MAAIAGRSAAPRTPPDMPFSSGTPRFGRTGLENGQGWAAFLDSILRGLGQVVFLDNAYTGLLCLIGVFLTSPLHAAAAFAGSLVGTVTAMALRADPAAVRGGLFGYNGCLVAIAVPMFLGGGPAVWGLALLAAALSSVLLMQLRPSRTLGLPPLTAPFVLCTWAAITTVAMLGGESGAARTVPVPQAGLFGDWTILDSAFSGIAQVFLQSGPLSGAVIALALLVGGRSFFALACLAGLASTVGATLVGAPVEGIRAGLFGFNGVLAALALGTVFLRQGGLSLGVAVLVAVGMPVFQTVCAVVLSPLGLPTASVPFLLVTWAVLSLMRRAGQFRPAV